MIRRRFLATSAVLGVAGLTRGPAALAEAATRQARLDQIGIMSWSFDRILKTPDEPNDPARTLDIMDLPRMYAERYGLHNIELQHDHLLSTEPEYLTEFRARVQAAGSRITQINLETDSDLRISAPTISERLEATDLTKKWIDHAVMLGCPRVMVNQGSLVPETRTTTVETLRNMARYGDSRSVWVTMENRGRDWEAVRDVTRAAGSYMTPDIGNFPDQESQLKGIPELFPMARGNAHIKMRFDLPRAIALMKSVGFTGVYSIEASTTDPHENVQKILDVLVANV